MHFGSKAQSSIEYMMIAVFLLTALVVVLAVSFNIFTEQKAALQVAEARAAANDIAEMANFLCTSPRNSTARASVFLSPSIALDRSSIDNRTIKFAIITEETDTIVTAVAGCNVTGTLPSASGTYVFRGVSKGGSGGSVAINYTPEIKSLRPSAG